jgi:hypothetical protein
LYSGIRIFHIVLIFIIMSFRHFSFFIFICFVLLSAVFLESCEYHTDKENFQDVKKPDSATCTIILDPLDTIYYLSEGTGFSYQSFSGNRKLYFINVFIDTVKVAENDESHNFFYVDVNKYSDGYHKLAIVATTGSGSGSLADFLGAEGFVFTFNWDLYIDKTDPYAVPMTKIFNQDGILKIEWDKFHKLKFESYEVIKTTIESNLFEHTTTIASINNREHNYCFDSAYFGGLATYKIVVHTPSGAIEEGRGMGVNDSCKIHAEWINEDLVKIYWDRCKYTVAFKQYQVYQNDQLVFSTSNIDSTFFIKHIGIIGESTKYELKILGNDKENTVKLLSETHQTIGLPFPQYNGMFVNNINASFYLKTDWKLYNYNSDTRKAMDSVNLPYSYFPFLVSPSGNVLVCVSPTLKYNQDNLRQTQPFNMFCYNVASLTNDGLGLTYTNSEWILYDFVNMKVVSTYTGPNWDRLSYVSEDGKFVFWDDYRATALVCHKLESGQLVKKWENPQQSFSFIPGEPDKIMLLNNSVCEIRNIETNQILNSFNTESFKILGVDPLYKTVILQKYTDSGKIVVFNYQTGQKVNEYGASFEYNLNYFRGSIYSTNGFEVPLSLKK